VRSHHATHIRPPAFVTVDSVFLHTSRPSEFAFQYRQPGDDSSKVAARGRQGCEETIFRPRSGLHVS
jgi:hypothetical protein